MNRLRSNLLSLIRSPLIPNRFKNSISLLPAVAAAAAAHYQLFQSRLITSKTRNNNNKPITATTAIPIILQSSGSVPESSTNNLNRAQSIAMDDSDSNSNSVTTDNQRENSRTNYSTNSTESISTITDPLTVANSNTNTTTDTDNTDTDTGDIVIPPRLIINKLCWLVGIDGSENSFRALELVITILQNRPVDELIVLNVPTVTITDTINTAGDNTIEYLSSKIDSGNYFHLADEQIGLQPTVETIERLIDEQTALILKIRDWIKLVPNHRLIIGNAAISARDQLLIVAGDEKCDILALGRRGKSLLAKLLLGSVTEYAIAFAPCHVLIVK